MEQAMKNPTPWKKSTVEPKAAKPAAAPSKAAKAAEGKKYDPSHRLGKWLWPKKGEKK
jgi:hypothetical protein